MMDNVLKFNGELTINNVYSWKKKFLDILTKPGDIVIDITRVKKMDSGFFQLLCSLHLSCLKNNRKLHIKANDEFWCKLEEIGYLRGELLCNKDN